MSDRTAFLAFAREFELAFVTDDWARLEPHLLPDASRIVPGSGVLAASDRGRARVIEGLRDGVYALDRRFDARIAEVIEGPVERPDGLFMRWRLVFVRAGLPELELEGDHLAVYRDGLLERIEERVAPEAQERTDTYLALHDAALRPVASNWAEPTANLVRRIQQAMMRSTVRAYGAAKSQQDIDGALAGCAPDFAIDTIPFGFDTGDRESTRAQLGLFFAAFPDYRAETEGVAVDDQQVAWWGSIRVTSSGPLLGLPPTGRSTRVPAFSVFDFRGHGLVRERFQFDLVRLCEGLAMPHEAVVKALLPLRTRATG